MDWFLVFVVVLVVVLVVIPLAIAQWRRANEAWTQAARKLGFHSAAPTLFGRRQIHGLLAGPLTGGRIAVYTYSRGSGKNRTTYTCFRLTFPRALGIGLQLSSEGFFSGITKFFGAQDIATGDESFDSAVLIKGADPRRVLAFLTPARRARIRRFLVSFRGASIDDRQVSWSRRGVVRDAATIISTVRHMIELARSLVGPRRADRALERALSAQREGRLHEAFEAVRSRRLGAARASAVESPAPRRPAGSVPDAVEAAEAEPEPEPDAIVAGAADADVDTDADEAAEADALAGAPVEEAVLEGEILYLAGREDEARDAFERAREDAPEDPEVRGWLERVSGETGPSTGAAADTDATPVPERGGPGPDAGAGIDVSEVCAALFAEDLSSFDTLRVFEERYRGKRVAWSGTLRSVDTYSFDFVFGDGPGTRVTVAVGRTAPTVYSASDVLAVVELPAAAADPLRPKVGGDIAFEGTLEKADGFMKNLFLRDGRVP